jgi:NAD(P)H-hydrate epimerase
MNDLVLTREQAAGVDRLAVASYGMSSLVLMENAGRGCADILCREGVRGPVVICCGKGNNGGDGFVLARHLDLRGHAVRVLMWSPPDQLSEDAAVNHAILRQAGIPVTVCDAAAGPPPDALAGAEWIVDALLGTGVRGDPRPPLDQVIRWMNEAPGRRLAVDIPSGLDCQTGQAGNPTLRAERTCTFVALKQGFLAPSAKPYLGRVDVLDIGTPRAVLEQVLRETRDS